MNQLPPLQLPPLRLPSTEVWYSTEDVRRYARRERHRIRFDAAVSLLFTLLAGWGYAQLARKMGAPSHLIGGIAVGIQVCTFALCMWTRPHEWRLWRRK